VDIDKASQIEVGEDIIADFLLGLPSICFFLVHREQISRRSISIYAKEVLRYKSSRKCGSDGKPLEGLSRLIQPILLPCRE